MLGIIYFLVIILLLDLVFISLFKLLIKKSKYLTNLNKKYRDINNFFWYIAISIVSMILVYRYKLFDADFSVRSLKGYLLVSTITSLILSLFTLEIDWGFN